MIWLDEQNSLQLPCFPIPVGLFSCLPFVVLIPFQLNRRCGRAKKWGKSKKLKWQTIIVSVKIKRKIKSKKFNLLEIIFACLKTSHYTQTAFTNFKTTHILHEKKKGKTGGWNAGEIHFNFIKIENNELLRKPLILRFWSAWSVNTKNKWKHLASRKQIIILINNSISIEVFFYPTFCSFVFLFEIARFYPRTFYKLTPLVFCIDDGNGD